MADETYVLSENADADTITELFGPELFFITKDPSGTPQTKLVTWNTLKTLMLAGARALNILTNADIVSGVLTPEGTTDLVRITALGAALTTADPSSAFADGDGFVYYLEDSGTSRALTWGSKYADSEFASLPAATVAGKRHRLGFEYHAGDDKLYCMYAEVET